VVLASTFIYRGPPWLPVVFLRLQILLAIGRPADPAIFGEKWQLSPSFLSGFPLT
jgi:hypothetical protein